MDTPIVGKCTICKGSGKMSAQMIDVRYKDELVVCSICHGIGYRDPRTTIDQLLTLVERAGVMFPSPENDFEVDAGELYVWMADAHLALSELKITS